MPRKAKPKKASIHDLSKKVPEGDAIYEILLSLNDQRDHIAAIVGTAFIEYAVRQTIVSRLRYTDEKTLKSLFDERGLGPLETLSAKVRIAHALGAFGPVTKADLDRIRTIRNAFAHSMVKVDFRTPEVLTELHAMHILREPVLDHIMKATWLHPRRKFLIAVTNYYFSLTTAGMGPQGGIPGVGPTFFLLGPLP